MGFDVKITTKCGILDLLCPHTCMGCGQLGTIYCECCKKNILKNRQNICPICKQKLAKKWKCDECENILNGVFVAGMREGDLAKMISNYKYYAVRAIGEVLTEVIDGAIPEDFDKSLSGLEGDKSEVVIVPLPTIGRHVRQRGIDHTWRLGKKLAKRRGWRCERVLGRAADTVQVGTKATDRQAQAARAYEVVGKVVSGKRYLLLDDVWTTGASMLAAAKVMQEAGTKEMFGVVIGVSR